ncbi:N-acetylglucosamine kinase [Mucilaginibacter terrigena]|uniref:N-acetylglucosamine kinase n=1 Tax=Mucilaginibacter terrigena TaxID=2492395 RepID=A0A4Q5LND8_9SPHI|nr:N-acetylglucosamine kinase [Mucilaginibacter terrigena]RYU90925.1 N-acetylglucosamine kinase [Mucilaginibacter terrigena]
MILIADGGSTKSSWCIADAHQSFFFETEGYNPYFVDSAYIARSLKKALPPRVSKKITEIYFYGAGCAADKIHIIQDALLSIFTNARCHIEDDMLAAARALLGNKPGFAAILGTGTNTCIYDGKNITHNIDSLGFILGDEGSGGAMGKRIISDYIRGAMPGDIRQIFERTYHITADELIDNIYSKPMANRFCAAYSRFLYDNIKHPYAHGLVSDSFNNLFSNLVSKYPDYKQYKFNCVGSIAYYYKWILASVAAGYGMQLGLIVRSPINDLVNFHLDLFYQYQ